MRKNGYDPAWFPMLRFKWEHIAEWELTRSKDITCTNGKGNCVSEMLSAWRDPAL